MNIKGMGLWMPGAVALMIPSALAAVGACTTGEDPAPASSSSPATPQSACDHLYAVLTSQRCDHGFGLGIGIGRLGDAALLPPDQVDRLRPDYETLCQRVFSAPGSSVTPALVDACASTLEAAACRTYGPSLAACRFPGGSLPAGAGCFEPAQCQSDSCDFTEAASTDGGTSQNPACGRCGAVAALGQKCGVSGGSSLTSCPQGATCACVDGSNPCAHPTCLQIAYGDVGVACDDFAQKCDDGLYCDVLTMRCATLLASGGACVNDPFVCQWPLTCTGATTLHGTCGTGGAVGAACTSFSDCQPGLECDAAGKCASLDWGAQPGQACGPSGGCELSPCLGTTSPGGKGTCPNIIPNGQACSESGQAGWCDGFSDCGDGTCQVTGSFSCP